jgi:hypothetical protein
MLLNMDKRINADVRVDANLFARCGKAADTELKAADTELKAEECESFAQKHDLVVSRKNQVAKLTINPSFWRRLNL